MNTNLFKVRAYWAAHNAIRYEVIDSSGIQLANGFTAAADARTWIRERSAS